MKSVRLGIACCLVLSLSLSPGGVFAHAAMVNSEPGRRAVLTIPPREIRLCFNENIEADFSTVDLADNAGKKIPLTAPVRDSGKPYCLTVPLPELQDGAYTVKYRVLSVDGHVVDYGYGFRLETRSGDK